MAEIEQPAFDELATGTLADLEETGEAIIEDAHFDGIHKLGVTTGTYYAALIEMEVPPKEATKPTVEWMHLCEGSDA